MNQKFTINYHIDEDTFPKASKYLKLQNIKRSFEFTYEELCFFIAYADSGFGNVPQLSITRARMARLYWPLLKYNGFFDGSNRLRVNYNFEKYIDSHQKGAFSDDVGMGMSLLFNNRIMGVKSVADMKYALKHLVNKYHLYVTPNSRSTPDFLMCDVNKNIYIVECKGTITSNRNAQVKRAKQQLLNIKDPKGCIDERVVFSTVIQRNHKLRKPELLISDPEFSNCDFSKVSKDELIRVIIEFELIKEMGLLGLKFDLNDEFESLTGQDIVNKIDQYSNNNQEYFGFSVYFDQSILLKNKNKSVYSISDIIAGTMETEKNDSNIFRSGTQNNIFRGMWGLDVSISNNGE